MPWRDERAEGAAAAGDEPDRDERDDLVIRVASYNVHRCVGGDGHCNPARTVEVLRELQCDLIGLQEVDNSAGPAATSLQLDYLASSTGMNAAAGFRLVRHMGQYGNALLTRHRILTARRHDLSLSWREPRGALEVDLEIHGIESRVVVTHLGLLPHERRHQMRKILTVVGETPPERPFALLGDINEWLPMGRPLRWLHALFGRPPSAPSFPARYPVFALDRIWTRPRGSLRAVRAHRSPAARAASDHLPVVGEWSLSRDVRSRRER
jgi:endonuclease/exonuclease/phosphatase family metal-dependent hydrolase